MKNRIATEILTQLGGGRFVAVTGSNRFVSGENFLGMKLTRNKSGANYLKVTLTSMDVYIMEFISIRGRTMKTKKEFNGVYNDQLQGLFTEATGLYTTI